MGTETPKTKAGKGPPDICRYRISFFNMKTPKEHAARASLQLVAARLWAYQEPLDDKPLPIAALASCPEILSCSMLLLYAGFRCNLHGFGVFAPEVSQSSEVFAGSLHGGAGDMSSIGSFLGLSLPIPQSPGWKKLFEDNLIATDGFVEPKNRIRVRSQDASFDLSLSPFVESPVSQVRQLYEARHLGAALRQAPVARLLGVCTGD